MRAVVELLAGARRLVIFTGAGVSAESGIPTFRDALGGLWARYDPAALATPAAFADDPALVWGWYEWRRLKVLGVQPNPAHRAIAALSGRIADTRLVTQNVDDLHERAGSRDVLHLHGSLHAPRCATCAAAYRDALPDSVEPEEGRRIEPPRCPACGGQVRPGAARGGAARGFRRGLRVRPVAQRRHFRRGAAGGADTRTGAGARCQRRACEPATGAHPPSARTLSRRSGRRGAARTVAPGVSRLRRLSPGTSRRGSPRNRSGSAASRARRAR